MIESTPTTSACPDPNSVPQDRKPLVLRIETGYCSARVRSSHIWTEILDYEIYSRVPRWWRAVEEKLGIDIVLAYRARSRASEFDLLWADSEKVGFPLALMFPCRPIVTVGHHCASVSRRWLFRLLRITKSWAGIGYWSDADRDFFMSYYGVPPSRLFNAAAPEFDYSPSIGSTIEGPIISIGVAKRDYDTLIAALSELPECETHVYAGSRYGDLYKKSRPAVLPSWVHFMDYVSHDEMEGVCRNSRFVVVPLEDTTQFSVGLSVIAEAGAAGKAVIATETRGIRAHVEDGVTGILVPPYDIAALRSAIGRLWGNPELAHQMGMAGRRHVEKELDPHKTNRTIEQFLSKTFAEHSTR